MSDAFVLGALAGYGIAVPVGPIAVLVMRTAMLRGMGAGLAAAAGAATADLVYAGLAAIAGGLIVGAIAPALIPMRVLAAAALVLLAWRAIFQRSAMGGSAGEGARPAGRTYALLLGLTLLNPITIAYFVTLAVGLPEIASDGLARVSFALGAGLASLSWQVLLATVGAALRMRLTPEFARLTGVASGVILFAFAFKIAKDTFAL